MNLGEILTVFEAIGLPECNQCQPKIEKFFDKLNFRLSDVISPGLIQNTSSLKRKTGSARNLYSTL